MTVLSYLEVKGVTSYIRAIHSLYVTKNYRNSGKIRNKKSFKIGKSNTPTLAPKTDHLSLRNFTTIFSR